MTRLLNDEVLTKEKLIELLQQAKQDENGHWYVDIPHYKYSETDEEHQRAYFGMFYTVCQDFVKEFTLYSEHPDTNTEHYNRHFINDDTFELFVAKNK